MELKELTKEQLIELTTKTEDKDAMREIATHLEIGFSGNTGTNTLKGKILEHLNTMPDPSDESEEPEVDEDLDINDPVAQALISQNKAEAKKEEDVHVKQDRITYSVTEMLEMDAAQVKDAKLRKAVIRAQALRLRRVKITNLDPADAPVTGTIVSVITKYTGKVAKFIPYDEESYEHGYHVPQCIIDDLKARTYTVRKEIKKRGSIAGVKEYKNVNQKKFVIEFLPDLTKEQLQELGKQQQARGAIDRS